MHCILRQEEWIADRLRLALPFAAYGKPGLVRYLRSCLSIGRTSPRLTVTNVFYAGEDRGLMCHFLVEGAADEPRVFVAPFGQVALGRGHPIAQEIAVYRERGVNLASGMSSSGGGRQCPR